MKWDTSKTNCRCVRPVSMHEYSVVSLPRKIMRVGMSLGVHPINDECFFILVNASFLLASCLYLHIKADQ